MVLIKKEQDKNEREVNCCVFVPSHYEAYFHF